MLVVVAVSAGCASGSTSDDVAGPPVGPPAATGDFVAEVDDIEPAPPVAQTTPSPAPAGATPAPEAAGPTQAPATPLRDPTAVLAEASRRAAAAARPSAAEPAHLSIPSIGVDTPTIDLDLSATEAEVPVSFHVAGWYRQTRTPGTVGPAVIVGHVGSRDGPGVFARLDQLRPGDEIHVTGDDGGRRVFVVDRGALVDKYDRPPEVFGWGQDRPELRLITCGGDFDPTVGHHVSNYVVWAHEVEP